MKIHILCDILDILQKVYECCCSACNNKYIGKTDRNFGSRVQEHSGLDKKSPVLFECEHFNYVVNLHSLPPSNNSLEYLEHVKIAVYDKTPKLSTTVKIGLNYVF